MPLLRLKCLLFNVFFSYDKVKEGQQIVLLGGHKIVEHRMPLNLR